MRFRLQYLSNLTICLLVSFSAISCKEKKDRPTVAPPVRVTVLPVMESLQTGSREYSATVSSENSTTVSFPVSGTIEALYASEGQKVSKGQILGKVKSGDYENARNIAMAELAEAQDGYNRLKKLHDANALPDVKWVEMQQKLKQAENAAEMANRTLSDATLHSPVNGTVSRKFADVGQTIAPIEPVYEIVSTEALTIDVPVAENEIGEFFIGRKAHVSFENPDIPALEGKVTQKSVVADPLTRSFTVKIAVGSADGKILPGMIAGVVFETPENEIKENPGVMLPPQAVLLSEDNRLFVWVVKNGEASRRFVEADELVANGVLVKSGLEPNDSVIIEGMQKVGTGSKVVVVTK